MLINSAQRKIRKKRCKGTNFQLKEKRKPENIAFLLILLAIYFDMW